MKICKTANCGNKLMAKGLCNKCYYRVKNGGTPELSKKQQQALRVCSIEGCGKSHVGLGLCQTHYRRQLRHGDPNFINPKCNRDGKYKERHKEYRKQWFKENKKAYAAYLASRKKRVKQATPRWADMKAIRDFYFNCPPGYHVDHIVPILGKNVSGLHTIDNLQYLPAKENLSKGNKHESDKIA